MAYATVQDLKMRLDQRLVQYLSDENEYGVENEEVLNSALEGASVTISAIVPDRFKDNTNFMKELELLKAMEMLYRRFGYFTEAETLRQEVDDAIKFAIESSVESGRQSYSRDPKYYTEQPLITSQQWRDAFSDVDTSTDIS